MLITTEHLTQIFSLLQTSADTTFLQVITQFNKHVSKQEHARIALLFKFCLDDKLFANHSQNIIIYYLCHYIYQQNLPCITPNTASTLLELLHDKHKEQRPYQFFVLKLLSNTKVFDVC